jgi:hypothetical protein
MISNVPGALNQAHKAILIREIDKALKGEDK